MEGKQIPWPTAAVIIAVIAGVVILVSLGRDVAGLVGIGAAIFGAIGLGVGKAQSIEAKVNGNISRMLDQHAEQTRMLAAAIVPPTALTPPQTPDPAPAGTTGTTAPA